MGLERSWEVGVGRVACAGEDGRGRGQPKMFKYGSYRLGLSDDSDKLKPAVAVGAFQGIDVINPFEKCCPFEFGKAR